MQILGLSGLCRNKPVVMDFLFLNHFIVNFLRVSVKQQCIEMCIKARQIFGLESGFMYEIRELCWC